MFGMYMHEVTVKTEICKSRSGIFTGTLRRVPLVGETLRLDYDYVVTKVVTDAHEDKFTVYVKREDS